MTQTDTTTDQAVQAPTDPTAVVEDGMLAATPSEPGWALAGHLDARYVQESIEAAAVLNSYALVDEDGTTLGLITEPIDMLAEQMADETGRTVDDQMFLLVRGMIDRRISKQGWLGSVSLDLNPAEPGRPQDLGHPDVPAVLFYEVRPGSSWATCGSCAWCAGVPDSGEYCQTPTSAIAVWFQPEVDELGYAVSPRRARNGRMYSDDTFIAGYHGIITRYPSIRRAWEAQRELRNAVRTLATPVTADVPDTVREVGVESDEHNDRAQARARRTGVRRERSAF